MLEAKKLDINTLEGWNEMIRQYNIKDLIEKDIEPTEENLNKYQEEKNILANEMIKDTEEKNKLEPVPIYYYVGQKRFEIEEDAKRYSEHIRNMGKMADLIFKIVDNSTISDIPYEQIKRILDSLDYRQEDTWYKYSSIYMLGYLKGVRAERVKRRTQRNKRNIVK